MLPESKLLATSYVFAAANGKVLSPDEVAEISATNLKDTDARLLADEICESLDTVPDLSSAYRSAAFWALGKCFNPTLLDFFRRHLAIEAELDMQVAYQIMIALDNLEEPVWPAEPTSFGVANSDQNHLAAIRYLNKCAS